MMRCHDVKDKIHITKQNEAWIESPRSGARTTAEDAEYQKCTFLFLIVLMVELNIL